MKSRKEAGVLNVFFISGFTSKTRLQESHISEQGSFIHTGAQQGEGVHKLMACV